MGRPVNKRYFGEPTPDGQEIKVQFHNGTASVDGWIVKQMGSKKFLCSDGTNEAICWIVDVAAGALVAGEMSISVKDDAGTVTRITKISGRTVTAGGVKTAWNFSDSVIDNAVEMEEAGPGTVLPVTAGDFVVGNDYTITVPGTTDFTLIGAADSNASTVFTATGEGTGDGTATPVTDPADIFGI